MWKLLWVATLVAVLSTYYTCASERSKRVIKNNYQIQDLRPPTDFSLKRQDAVVIESAFSGYDYTTPKSDGYVYTPGYVYKTPNVTLSVRTTTRKSTPGIIYLPPTPSTTTTTTTTTPSTTTTSTTTTTTPKPTYLPPYERTYLPPPEPPREYVPVRPTPMPYPAVSYGPIRIETITRRYNPNLKPAPPPTTPRPTPRIPLIRGYEYLPPKEYLPAFKYK